LKDHLRQNQNRKGKSVCASKLREAQVLIIDARYLAGLVEVAVDRLETPTDLAISAAAHVAIEKLNEAMNLLDQAQAGGALDDRPPVSACLTMPVARSLPSYLMVNLKRLDSLSCFPVSYVLAIERLRWRCAGAASLPCTPFREIDHGRNLSP
jgi:hypothetical protein